jgi:hypothetical protein
VHPGASFEPTFVASQLILVKFFHTMFLGSILQLALEPPKRDEHHTQQPTMFASMIDTTKGHQRVLILGLKIIPW